jgi:hypothetical protein
MLSSAPDAHYSLAELSTPFGTVKQVIALRRKMLPARGAEPGNATKKKPLNQGLRTGAGTTNRTQNLLVTSLFNNHGVHRDTRFLHLESE